MTLSELLHDLACFMLIFVGIPSVALLVACKWAEVMGG
jgi:hypothetical protein